MTAFFTIAINLGLLFNHQHNTELLSMNPDLFTATNLIVAITCVVSFLAFNNPVLRGQLIFHPLTINRDKQWYRFITLGVMHG